MIVCVHLPRFELVIAAGDRADVVQQALAGRALAIAPQVGGEQRLGEVSGAGEARGVAPGMMLGEAFARCPDLILVPPDPVGVAEAWEAVLGSLESIGAAVEPGRPGLAWFAVDGLRGLHGTDAATIDAARRAGRYPIGGGRARIGVGPTRFCALAAALAVRSRSPVVAGERGAGALLARRDSSPEADRRHEDRRAARRWLAGRPIELLGYRSQTEALVQPLSRLGVRTLGELARLGRPALADRFGEAGALAHRLACGEDTPLRARRVQERLQETMTVGDASSGPALERVLRVLVDRLLARPERRGRALCAVTLSARLIAGGAWCVRAVFRQALSEPERIGLALSVRLRLLPAPASALGLTVERFGPPAGEQSSLLDQDRGVRAVRLREAIGQMRAAAGQDAALRAVCVDPDSRVPERRVLLAPIPE